MATERNSQSSSAAHQSSLTSRLCPAQCGVANNDIDWMARGNSVTPYDKGLRRDRSNSTPQKPVLPISNTTASTILPTINDSVPIDTDEYASQYTLQRTQTMPTERLSNTRRGSDARTMPLEIPRRRGSMGQISTTTTMNVGSTPKKSWMPSFIKFHHHNSPPMSPTDSRPISPIAEKANLISESAVSPVASHLNPPRTASPQISTEAVATAKATVPPGGGKLMDRLKRISSRQGTPISSTTSLSSAVEGKDSKKAKQPKPKVVLNKNWNRRPPCKLAELEGVLPKRVMFAPSVMERDPPQQIPSRHPKPGNIQVLANGDVVRATNTIPGIQAPGIGINTGPNNGYYLPRNYSATALQASQTAYEVAQRISNSLKSSAASSFRARIGLGSSNEEDDDDEDDELLVQQLGKGKNLKIDTPMNEAGGFEEATSDPSVAVEDKEEEKIDNSLEAIYTRCCHLREILPIPATMRQVKGKRAPLDVIRMMNPRPTLIEVLAFADLLSVVPVHIVVLDNATLTDEMVGIILSGLRNAVSLIKISLKNVVFSDEGWKALCAFMVDNNTILRLDLSIQVDPKRTKQVLKPGVNRAHLDWCLFNKAMVARGGIQELLINGCMIPSEALADLVRKVCTIGTMRLGLAMNDLCTEDLRVIREWIERPDCQCEGLDLGGNDLSQSWDVVLTIVLHKKLSQLSLNSCNFTDVESAKKLIAALAQNKQLRFLDLSANAMLFPKITQTLVEWLPLFRDLRRLHLESCNITTDTALKLAEAVAKCEHLVHFSILHNRLDPTACTALVTAVDISDTLYTLEIDKDLIPETLQRRLAYFCLVNMEAMVEGRLKDRNIVDEQFKKDGGELVEVGNELVHAMGDILRTHQLEKSTDDALKCSQVVEMMVKRGKAMRDWIRDALDQLFEKKRSGNLDTKSKETLIRLVFLDGNLEKVLSLYDERLATTKAEQIELSIPHVSTQLAGIQANPVSITSPTHPDLQVEPIQEEPSAMVTTLSRQNSSTSLHAKAQAKEEGEFHRFSTFMRDQPAAQHNTMAQMASGEQVRRAILSAKGDETVTSLIEKVKKVHGPELERILSVTDDHDVLLNNNNDKEQSSLSSQEDSQPDTEVDDATLDQVINDLAKVLTREDTSEIKTKPVFALKG